VAIQEVREDLSAIEQLKYILGDESWDYILTDVTEGRRGNRERMAFLYDAKKVRFGGLAGEIVLPEGRARTGASSSSASSRGRHFSSGSRSAGSSSCSAPCTSCTERPWRRTPSGSRR